MEQGVHALTVRRIGQVSGLNGTLVTYYFGAMASLIGELATRNLAPMLADWAALDAMEANQATSVRAILEVWLRPLLRAAAFHTQGRALLVLDELAAHGLPALREDVMGAMVDVAARVRALLAPLLPHLTEAELAARLRFIAGATLGPPPRGHAGAAEDFERLLAFALAGLGA